MGISFYQKVILKIIIHSLNSVPSVLWYLTKLRSAAFLEV